MKNLQCLAIAAMTWAWAQPAAAANVAPYGDLYLFLGTEYATAFAAGGVESSDFDLEYSINRHSNLGFSFRWADYGGVFELGMLDIETDERRVWVRKAYGEYAVSFLGNELALLIGQNFSPFVRFSNEMANYFRSEGFGAMYQEPTVQLQVSYAGFHVAILKPIVPVNSFKSEQQVVTPTSGGAPIQEYALEDVNREITTGLPEDKIRSYVPALVVGCTYEADSWRLSGGAGANVYAVEDTEDVQFTRDWVYSYIIFLNANVTLNKFRLGLSVGFAANPANFGILTQSKGNITYAGGAAVALENVATGKFALKDTWNVQGYFEVGYEISEASIVHIGYGYSHVKYPIPGTEDDLAMEGYLNWRLNLGSYVALIPSVSYRNYMQDMAGNDEGWDLFAGILGNVSFH